jgi:hypothetical protein
MAETRKPCCESTLREARRRYLELTMSYPVIKEFPCPTCSTILKLRIYGPAEEEQETPNA